MATFSTPQVAKQLGLTAVAIGRYIKLKKIPAPKTIEVGGRRVYVWSERNIARVRDLLPKIKNGRKTRYKKGEKKSPPKRKKKS
jgi:predicted DNA-binding transcriptional regulator AlpA